MDLQESLKRALFLPFFTFATIVCLVCNFIDNHSSRGSDITTVMEALNKRYVTRCYLEVSFDSITELECIYKVWFSSIRRLKRKKESKLIYKMTKYCGIYICKYLGPRAFTAFLETIVVVKTCKNSS